jgi:hypothetical protein
MQHLKELWTGQMPLEIAFWRYAIFYGFILNLATTLVALLLFAMEVPVALAVAVFLVPVPYSVVAICGVWRSADRHAKGQNFAAIAKVGVVVWFCVWLVL